MDRVAQLVHASGELRRRLFAALPLHVRFAAILVAFSIEHSIETVNQMVSAALLAAGVTEGMPPIKGKPPAEYLAEKFPNKVPGKDRDALFGALVKSSDLKGYGGGWIGKRALAMARAVVKIEAHIPDLLQNFLARFFTSGALHKLDAKYNAHQAVDFALDPIRGMSKNVLKQEKRDYQRNGPMVTKDDEGEEKELELADKAHDVEGIINKLDNEVVMKILNDPKVQHDLKSKHPDALQYLHLLMQDYGDVEILGMAGPDKEIGPAMIPHPFGQMGKRLYPASWQSIKKKIFEVLHRAIDERVHHHQHAVMAGDFFGLDPEVDYSALGVVPSAA